MKTIHNSNPQKFDVLLVIHLRVDKLHFLND